MKRIQRLEVQNIRLIRSTVVITSLADCIAELVLNSIDASSSSININLDGLNASVQDNGIGMDNQEMRSLITCWNGTHVDSWNLIV